MKKKSILEKKIICMNNNNKALAPKLWGQLYSTIDLLGLVTQ